MGAEIDAAKTVIYNRLLSDSTFNNYVSGRIYDHHVPAGEADPCSSYRLLDNAAVARAHATLGYTLLRFKVMVWNKTATYAAISARAERIRVLFNGHTATSGSYNLTYYVGAPIEQKNRLKGGGYRSWSGYEVLAVVQTGSYVAAGGAYLAFGAAGSEFNLTPYAAHLEMRIAAAKHVAGRIDATWETSSPGHLAAILIVRGLWAAAAESGIRVHLGATGKSVIWGPEGNGTGKVKVNSGGAYILSYKHVAPEGEISPVEFELVIAVSDSLSWGTF